LFWDQPPFMPFNALRAIEITAGAIVVAGLGAAGAWLLLRRRPTPAELEIARRHILIQSGRLVDGTLLDICEVPAEDGARLTMLLYGYRIGGVDYQCTQDVSDLLNVVDVDAIRAGFPCSVRYQPGNPQNSIVVAETWSGLRDSPPFLPAYNRGSSADRPSLG
jgi:hypothetical protein